MGLVDAQALELTAPRIASTLASEPMSSFAVAHVPAARLGLAPWVLVALLLTAWAPLHVALLAPLLFGVPHVVEDLRAFVLRPVRPVAREALWAIGLLLGALSVARAQSLFGGPVLLRFELGCGALALCAARWLRPERERVWDAGLAGLCVLGALCVAWPKAAALFVAHAHNLVALGVWAAWSPRGRGRALSILVYLLGLGLLSVGACDGLIARGLGWGGQVGGQELSVGGLELSSLANKLAPGLSPSWQARVVAGFVYAQALHFAFWVLLVPAALAPRERGLGARWAAWRRDLPPLLFACALVGAVGVPLLGWIDGAGARSLYLNLVLFHGWLELALIAHWGRA